MLNANLVESLCKCPFCGDYAILREIDSIINGINLRILSYECDRCRESFTTTESDTITVYRHNKAKRIFNRNKNRKNILKKIYEL